MFEEDLVGLCQSGQMNHHPADDSNL